ncbi:MAG: PAS domain-containing protein, partial [Planctomycetota bacterium]
IAIAIMIAIIACVSMIYFAMEYMIQPVLRHLVKNEIDFEFDKITTGNLQNRMMFCLTVAILMVALMISVLATQRAANIINSPHNQEQLIYKLQSHTIAITCGAFLIAIFLAVLLSRSIGIRVRALAKAMQRVESGDLSEQIEAFSNDELGAIGRSFNTLIKRLHKAYTSLEDKIAERTVQLSITNQELETEIATRKQIEDELRKNNERVEHLLSSVPAAIYTAKSSYDYGATFITENVKQITGYQPQAFLNRSGFWINHVHPEDRQRIMNELAILFEKGLHTYEYRFLHQDGSYMWMRDEMRLIKDDDGNPLEIIGYWIDITERKQAAEILQQAHDELEIRVGQRTAEIKSANQQLKQEIIERRQAEESLRNQEEAERRFQQQLTNLLDMSVQLSTIGSFDEFCRQTVEQSRSRLGFDRVGIWFFSNDQTNTIIGTFGTDENGQTRDERGIKLPFDEVTHAMFASKGNNLTFTGTRPLFIHNTNFKGKISVQMKTLPVPENPVVALIYDIPIHDREGHKIGTGTAARSSIWDGEKSIGFISVDNYIRRHPITDHDCELLALLASTIGHLYSRKQAENTLLKKEESEYRFQQQLTSLLDISIQLSQIDSFDDFCREAVEQARNRLGFDRVGILFFDKEKPGTLVGTFGTDDNGQTRDERNIRITVDKLDKEIHLVKGDHITTDVYETKTVYMRKEMDNDQMCEARVRRFVVPENPLVAYIIDKPFYDATGQCRGMGSIVRANILEADKIVGFVSIDNKINRRPITDHDCEILTLFTSIFGHLYSRKQTEEQLKRSAQVIENAGEGIVILDHNWQMTYCNASFTDIFGWNNPQDVMGKNWSFFIDNQEHKTETGPPAILEGNGKWQGRCIGRHRTGTPIPLAVTLARLGTGDGNYLIVGNIRDMGTEEMHLEKIRKLTIDAEKSLEGERARIARELHDELGQLLTALNMSLAHTKTRSSDTDKSINNSLDEALALVSQATVSLRHLSKSLRPPVLDHNGVLDAIKSHVSDFSHRTGIRCRVTATPKNLNVGDPQATTVFRILQEALTNVARHAQATRCDIAVRINRQSLEMKIKDNGRGATPKQLSGFNTHGIIGMQERAVSLGGSVTIENSSGSGVCITTRLPLKQPNND